MKDSIIARRTLLLGASGVVGVSALSGCETGSPDNAQSQDDNAQVTLPSYRDTGLVEPDLAGDADRMPGFLAYPAQPARSVTEQPITSGQTVTVLGTQAAAFLARDKNQVWQEIIKQVGADLKYFTATNEKDFQAKLQTTLAGGDLPDITQLARIPRLPDVLNRNFAELTDYLSGDKILEFPNLAAIPSWSWRGCVYNGGIYTLPVTRGKLGNLLLTRADILAAKGQPDSIGSGEELRSVCRALTDPAKNQWAFGQNPTLVVSLVNQMLGGANRWREQDGSFTHMWATDEYRRALEIVRQLAVDDKVFHPDSFGAADPQSRFTAGSAAIMYGSYATWGFQLRQGVGISGFKVGCYVAPKWDGGGISRQHVVTGPFQFSALKKASPDRIKELLRLANYWAAPFGSAEYLLRIYGLPGRDHTLVGGDPVLTDTGKNEVSSPVSTVISAAPTLYHAGYPDATKAVHKVQEQIVAQGLADPTVGLYSETLLAKGSTLDKKIADLHNDILSGRKPLSAWDEGIAQWNTDGGRMIADEYGKAFAEE